jgi:16S rRNA (guanine(1405)-N(7))-methyltransferase
LVRRVAEQEMPKGSNLKESVKSVRSKLHQVAGAYMKDTFPYDAYLGELRCYSSDPADPLLRSFCLQLLSLHASTRERLPIREIFFRQALARIAPVKSILDLACGLNPLALPWMPLAADCIYQGCDIYPQQAQFLTAFLQHVGVQGEIIPWDLHLGVPPFKTDVTLLLKTIPCLEQVDKTAGSRLLDEIESPHVLVSFPVRSLGGHGKGMLKTYETRLRQIIAGKPWQVERMEFATELAFLISK